MAGLGSRYRLYEAAEARYLLLRHATWLVAGRCAPRSGPSLCQKLGHSFLVRPRMKIRVSNSRRVVDLLLGIFAALRYPNTAPGQELVSHKMFVAALLHVCFNLPSVSDTPRMLQDRRNIQERMRWMMRAMGFAVDDEYEAITFEQGRITGSVLIPTTEVCQKGRSVDFAARVLGIEGFELQFYVHYHKRAEVEAAILMHWACCDYSYIKYPVTVANQTIWMGLWIAARLYECEGDMAGMLATIDEGLEKI